MYMFSSLSVYVFFLFQDFSMHDQTLVHGWFELLNAQFNPFPCQALVRHGGCSLILDKSVMTFPACNCEICSWQSGDHWIISSCALCGERKRKDVRIILQSFACCCFRFSCSCSRLCRPLWFCRQWFLEITHSLPLSAACCFFFFFLVLLRSVVEWDAFHYWSLSPHTQQNVMPGRSFFFSKMHTSMKQKEPNRHQKRTVWMKKGNLFLVCYCYELKAWLYLTSGTQDRDHLVLIAFLLSVYSELSFSFHSTTHFILLSKSQDREPWLLEF